MNSEGEITTWLNRLQDGDQMALDKVVHLMYDDLRRLACNRLASERIDHTLGATALVNEVYLKLIPQQKITAENRLHFFGIASKTMHRILVDYARKRKRLKRGGGVQHLPLEDEMAFFSESEADEMLVLEEALKRLEEINPRGVKVVECRFFGGMSVEDVAGLLKVSTKTVQRDWLSARAWLRKEVARDLNL